MPHDDDDGVYILPDRSADRPTGLGACARAATAAEAAFRVQYPNSLPRASRIVALDRGAAGLLHAISEDPWKGARFLILAPVQPDLAAGRVRLTGPDGAALDAASELDGADVVVLVATTDEGAGPAAAVGTMARARGIMTAGVVVAGSEADAVVRALRPSAAVLVMASDADYLPAMLTALRA
jgi:hypothetical protein